LRAPKKAILLIGAVILIAVLYGSTVGFSSAVDDFEPEVPPEPTEPTEPVTPVAYATFLYAVLISAPLDGGITLFEPQVSPYISPAEGRVYEKEKWTLISWSPDPPPPTEVVRVSVNIRVWGTGSNLAPQVWQSDWTTLAITELPADLSGESGRVFFYSEGTCYYTVALTIDSGRTGDIRVVATESGQFEVSV
jgi:hypothetical protein